MLSIRSLSNEFYLDMTVDSVRITVLQIWLSVKTHDDRSLVVDVTHSTPSLTLQIRHLHQTVTHTPDMSLAVEHITHTPDASLTLGT